VAFVADGGGGAMAGVDDSVVGEMHEFGFQRVDDLIERAAPKIGAANAAGEERVSGKELRFGEMDFTGILGEIQADTAGSVAGSVNNVGLEAAPTESVAFLEKMIDIDEIGSGHAEEVGLHVHGVIEGKIVAVHHDGSAGVLVELGEAADVINVGVGADDDLDGEFVAAEEIEDALDFVAGVDDDGFARFGVTNDQTIALKHADGQLDADHLRVSGVGEMQGVRSGGHWEKYSIVHLRGGFWVRDRGYQRTDISDQEARKSGVRVKEYKSESARDIWWKGAGAVPRSLHYVPQRARHSGRDDRLE